MYISSQRTKIQLHRSLALSDFLPQHLFYFPASITEPRQLQMFIDEERNSQSSQSHSPMHNTIHTRTDGKNLSSYP